MGFASGVCCIDVDTSEDHADGVAEWDKIAAAARADRHPRASQRDRRAASDFRFRAGRIGCSSGKLPKGIEVKGQGGYIVVPPRAARAAPTRSITTSTQARCRRGCAI